MESVAWEMTHSLEADVGLDFAWNYWTNDGKGVENWHDPPAEFKLDGPFTAGARGKTQMPGSPLMYWLIRECKKPETATIEMPLEGATISFEWRFEGLSQERTRLTQRVVLRGENAGSYIGQVESAFKLTLADGMKKMANGMELEAARKIQL